MEIQPREPGQFELLALTARLNPESPAVPRDFRGTEALFQEPLAALDPGLDAWVLAILPDGDDLRVYMAVLSARQVEPSDVLDAASEAGIDDAITEIALCP